MVGGGRVQYFLSRDREKGLVLTFVTETFMGTYGSRVGKRMQIYMHMQICPVKGFDFLVTGFPSSKKSHYSSGENGGQRYIAMAKLDQIEKVNVRLGDQTRTEI